MWCYDGKGWPSLIEACDALNLDYVHVIDWLIEHKEEVLVDPNSALRLYIEHNRFIAEGIIFSTLEGVANFYGVRVDTLREYMASGLGLELSAQLIRAGLSKDFFNRTREYETKQPRPQCSAAPRKPSL